MSGWDRSDFELVAGMRPGKRPILAHLRILNVRIAAPGQCQSGDPCPPEAVVSEPRLAIAARAINGPKCWGFALMSLHASALTHLGELLRLAEHRQRHLRLRIDFDEVPTRIRDAEKRVVDLESNHRADEHGVLREAVL